MIYRICTENKNQQEIRQWCNLYFKCYSMREGIGAWNGEVEQSLTIEIDDIGQPQPQLENHVLMVAHAIKALNRQEAVLIQRIRSDSELI